MTETAPIASRHAGSPCPSCGALKVHHSRRKGITERLLAIVGARIRRCHACNVRFAMLFNSALYIDDGRRALRRAALLMLLMLAGALLVILVMMWFMKKQAAIGPSDCLLVSPSGVVARLAGPSSAATPL